MKTIVCVFCILYIVQGIRLKRGRCEYDVSEEKDGFQKLRYSSKTQEECEWEIVALNKQTAMIFALTELNMDFAENGIKSCTGELLLPDSKSPSCSHSFDTKGYVTSTSVCKVSNLLSKVEKSRPELIVRTSKTSSQIVRVKSLSQRSRSFEVKFKVIDCTEKKGSVNSSSTGAPMIEERTEERCPASNEQTIFIIVIAILIVVVVALSLGLVIFHFRHRNVTTKSESVSETTAEKGLSEGGSNNDAKEVQVDPPGETGESV